MTLRNRKTAPSPKPQILTTHDLAEMRTTQELGEHRRVYERPAALEITRSSKWPCWDCKQLRGVDARKGAWGILSDFLWPPAVCLSELRLGSVLFCRVRLMKYQEHMGGVVLLTRFAGKIVCFLLNALRHQHHGGALPLPGRPNA